MVINQEVLNFLTGTAASLFAWIITLLFTAIISFTRGKKSIQKRIAANLDNSLQELTAAIENSGGRLDYQSDAIKIVELYRTHVSNYNSMKKIVKINQIDKLEKLLESKCDATELKGDLHTLKDTWKATVESMKKSLLHIDNEIGSKK